MSETMKRIMASPHRDEMLKIVAEECNVKTISFNGVIVFDERKLKKELGKNDDTDTH